MDLDVQLEIMNIIDATRIDGIDVVLLASGVTSQYYFHATIKPYCGCAQKVETIFHSIVGMFVFAINVRDVKKIVIPFMIDLIQCLIGPFAKASPRVTAVFREYGMGLP
jgi:hypothetical protein